MRSKIWKKGLAAVLSAALFVTAQPQGYRTYATEISEDGIEVSAEEENAVSEVNTKDGIVTVEETVTISAGPETEIVPEEEKDTEAEIETEQSEETETESETVLEETGSESEVGIEETETEAEISENSVSANEVTENKEEITLSSAQIQEKKLLSSVVKTLSSAVPGKDYAEGEVMFFADSREEALAVAESYHAVLTYYEYGVAVIAFQETDNSVMTVQEAVVQAADPDSDLVAVYPNYYKTLHTEAEYELEELNDPYMQQDSSSYQWYHQKVNAEYAWTKTKGAGVKVAVIDSGISQNHEDLKANIAGAWDMTGENNPEDTNGHGSNVAGIIAAEADNGKGGTGIAPEAQILSYKVLDSEGAIETAYIISSVRKAIEDGAKVINLSLGGYFLDPLEKAVMDEARANGVVVVASAGNENTAAYCYPAAYNNVISVVSLRRDNKKSAFSNYGSSVDISAPGGELKLDKSQKDNYFYYEEFIYSCYRNGGYRGLHGTSQAAPIVAGGAALIMAANPELQSATAVNAEEVGRILKSTARNIGSNTSYGAGCIDLAKAVGIDAAAPIPAADIANKSKIDAGTILHLACEPANEDVEIYYTLNGKTPTTANGNLYDPQEGIPLQGKGTVTVKAISSLYGKISKAAAYTYTYTGSKVENIAVSSANGNSSVGIKKNLKLTAAVFPSYAKNKTVKWSSADISIAKVNSSGVVTGVSEGTVVITAASAEDSQITGTFTVTVLPAVNKVILNVNSQSLKLNQGEEAQISASVMPAEAYGGLAYKSSNPKIVSVDAGGNVKALKSGTASVAVTAADGSGKKATCRVKVVTPVTKISISDKAGKEQICSGKTLTPKVVFNDGISKPDNTSLKWTKESDIANVIKKLDSKTGKVTVISKVSSICPVTIRATASNGVYCDYSFVVYPAVEEIVLTDAAKSTMYRAVGDIDDMNYYISSVTPSLANKELTFSSSNTSIVSVNAQTGIFTALKAGTAAITIKAADGSGKSKKVKISCYNELQGLGFVNPGKSHVLAVGKSMTLQLKAYPATAKIVAKMWKSTDESIAKVSKSGKITGKAPGEAIIQAAVMDSRGNISVANFTVVVYAATKSVALPEKSIRLKTGETYKLNPITVPEAAAGEYTYSSSNTKYVRVYSDGTVKALKKGTAVITVKARDGSGKTTKMTVKVTE